MLTYPLPIFYDLLFFCAFLSYLKMIVMSDGVAVVFGISFVPVSFVFLFPKYMVGGERKADGN